MGLWRVRVLLGYDGFHVVHSERKFQSHPTVPPGRLIEFIEMKRKDKTYMNKHEVN